MNIALEDPAVWNDPARAQELGKEKKLLDGVVITLQEVDAQADDLLELFEMAEDEKDDDTLEAIESDAREVEARVADLEFRRMFSHPMDPNPCFIEIQSGAGGTEA